MALEIERKFLVTGDFKALATGSSHIVQGYICHECGRTVRVRLRDKQGFLTVKGPSLPGGLARYEFETEIPAADACELLKLCAEGVIEKTRYLVPCGKHTYEVDEFAGDNTGLVVAEIELSHEDERFEKLAFVGQEVTGDRRYYNSQLCRYPYRLWKKHT